MTEAEWLTATDPDLLWQFVWKKWSDRKYRLYEAACCRQVWQLFTDERSHRAITAAEEFVDGGLADDQLEAIANAAAEVWDHELYQLPESDQKELRAWGRIDRPLVSGAAYNVAIPLGWWGGAPAFDNPSRIIREARDVPPGQAEAQSVLLRDIVGNPFRPVALDPAWRTDAVVGLAAGVYADRAFDRLPQLADALEAAGCTDAAVLTHCRGPGPHVRGCWVVDLLLGKT